MPLYNPPATSSRWFTDVIGGAKYEVGVDAYSRYALNPQLATDINIPFVSCFTCPNNMTVTSVSTPVHTAASSSLLTDAIVGLYEQRDSDPTRWDKLAEVPNEPTAWTTGLVIVTRNWSTPVNLVAGKRYGVAYLFRGSRPQLLCRSSYTWLASVEPVLAFNHGASTSTLPASLTYSSVKQHHVFAWLS